MNQADGAETASVQLHITYAILHAAQLIQDRLEQALGEVGLSVAKNSALAKLAEAERPLTLSELAAQLSCVRSNITQLVDRLEADGLVRRVDDPADRRSVRAELTELGVESQRAGAAALARAQQEISSRLSPGALVALEGSLSSLE